MSIPVHQEVRTGQELSIKNVSLTKSAIVLLLQEICKLDGGRRRWGIRKRTTSHDLHRIFRGINGSAPFHPMQRFSHLYSTKPADVAISYTWNMCLLTELPYFLDAAERKLRDKGSGDVLTFFIDIFFIDQNSESISEVVQDITYHFYGCSRHHLVLLMHNPLARAWILYEIAIRILASRQNTVEPPIFIVVPGLTWIFQDLYLNSYYRFFSMQAFDAKDLQMIMKSIVNMFGSHLEFDEEMERFKDETAASFQRSHKYYFWSAIVTLIAIEFVEFWSNVYDSFARVLQFVLVDCVEMLSNIVFKLYSGFVYPSMNFCCDLIIFFSVFVIHLTIWMFGFVGILAFNSLNTTMLIIVVGPDWVRLALVFLLLVAESIEILRIGVLKAWLLALFVVEVSGHHVESLFTVRVNRFKFRSTLMFGPKVFQFVLWIVAAMGLGVYLISMELAFYDATLYSQMRALFFWIVLCVLFIPAGSDILEDVSERKLRKYRNLYRARLRVYCKQKEWRQETAEWKVQEHFRLLERSRLQVLIDQLSLQLETIKNRKEQATAEQREVLLKIEAEKAKEPLQYLPETLRAIAVWDFQSSRWAWEVHDEHQRSVAALEEQLTAAMGLNHTLGLEVDKLQTDLCSAEVDLHQNEVSKAEKPRQIIEDTIDEDIEGKIIEDAEEDAGAVKFLDLRVVTFDFDNWSKSANAISNFCIVIISTLIPSIYFLSGPFTILRNYFIQFVFTQPKLRHPIASSESDARVPMATFFVKKMCSGFNTIVSDLLLIAKINVNNTKEMLSQAMVFEQQRFKEAYDNLINQVSGAKDMLSQAMVIEQRRFKKAYDNLINQVNVAVTVKAAGDSRKGVLETQQTCFEIAEHLAKILTLNEG